MTNAEGGINMGTCSECVYWRYDKWIAKEYGEGVGICELELRERFCSHQCPLCERRENT